MSQLKLLNFYKIVSNVATNLVGAFIPLIVLQATGSVAFGALSLIMIYLIRIISCTVFKKYFERYPQIILLLRVFTVIAYSVSIILIDVNLWVGVVGSVLFFGLDDSFRSLPREIVYNYSATDDDGGKSPLGFSRLMEQLGILIALVVGGVLLDVNKTLIVIISIIIYLISVIPLVIYYLKSRHQKSFNKDAESNARISYEKNPELKTNAEKISKKILWCYALTYFIFCFQDVLGNSLNIHIFLQTSSFGSAGYISAVYNAFYGIGCLLFSNLDSKKETTPIIAMSCVGCSILVLGIVLFNNVVWWYIAMALAGTFYGFICTFVLARLLPKCRIIGASNSALFFRENASNMSVIMCIMLGVTGSMIPVLIAIVVAEALAALVIPLNEERTRKLLIDYLQNHEKAMTPSRNEAVRNTVLYEQNPIIDLTGEDKKPRKRKSAAKKLTEQKKSKTSKKTKE